MYWCQRLQRECRTTGLGMKYTIDSRISFCHRKQIATGCLRTGSEPSLPHQREKSTPVQSPWTFLCAAWWHGRPCRTRRRPVQLSPQAKWQAVRSAHLDHRKWSRSLKMSCLSKNCHCSLHCNNSMPVYCSCPMRNGHANCRGHAWWLGTPTNKLHLRSQIVSTTKIQQ